MSKDRESALPPTRSKLIHEALSSLIGLPLSETYRAADVRAFGFGGLSKLDNGGFTTPYVIHIQTGWRLQTDSLLLTGYEDFLVHADGETAADWRPGTARLSIQDVLCKEFVFGPGGNIEEPMISAHTVSKVSADDLGGAVLRFSNEASLIIFPIRSRGELWRLFRGQPNFPHFVVSAESIGEEK